MMDESPLKKAVKDIQIKEKLKDNT